MVFVSKAIPLPAQIYNIKKKKFESLSVYMNYARHMYLAVKLDDNRILIFGGEGRETGDLKPKDHKDLIEAEIYDPKTNTFKLVGKSNYYHNRVNSSCLKLMDGRIFISSGDKIEIFDPYTEEFHVAGKEKRYKQISIIDTNGEKINKRTTINIYNHRTALALLNDGRVLIIGANYNGEPGNAEIYDPTTNEYKQVNEQVFPSFYRDATTLKDGRVLITGGTRLYYGYSFNKKNRKNYHFISNAEIFDPKTNTFSAISPLNIERFQHRSILLSNGKVLIVNGNIGTKPSSVDRAEIFDPITNTFKLIKSTKLNRCAFHIEKLTEDSVFINSYNGWEVYKY